MLVLYVTGHGFGHATRQSAVAAALLRLRPDLDLEVRTEAPAWIFQEPCPGLAVSHGGLDAGMVQRGALDVDLEASLQAQARLDRDWPRLVAEEAGWLGRRGARLVAGDIPPLAFSAAAAAGLPSIAVSNFCWDWIFEPYAAEDSRWEPARRRCADAYASAEVGLRLPLHGDFPAFRRVVDTPLLCRTAATTARQWRVDRRLPLDSRPIVLLAFGGFGVGSMSLNAGEDLSEFLFAGFGPKPAGLRADWVELRAGTSGDQLETMAACDIVISKPGYGIVSEALAHGKRMLYVPREGFREIAPLVSGLQARGGCAPLPREDLFAGRWRAELEGLFARPAPAAMAAGGDDWIAKALIARLESNG